MMRFTTMMITKLKTFAKAVWAFCSYLFWPQKRHTLKTEDSASIEACTSKTDKSGSPINMTQTKKGETKNQHYVPQFYQRYFSNDEATIGAYIIDKNKAIDKAGIKHQASEDYFYSENMKIEGALGDMEGLAATVIDKVLDNPKTSLSNEESYTLYAFTMIQIGRTLAQANFIQESADKFAQLMLRKYVEAKRNSADAKEVEGITDEVIDAVRINLNKPGLLSLGQHAQLVNTCIDLKCKVLINMTAMPFITSDNPACMYDTFFERIGEYTYALGSRGLQFYFPLSDKVALFYYDEKCYKVGERKKNYVEIGQEIDVKELNKLSACNSNKVLYYREGSIAKTELERLGTLTQKYKPSSNVETFEGFKNGNSEIVGSQHHSMFCHLSLSFVKELPKFKAITKETYNWNTDRLREIAYIKDDIVKWSFKK